MTEIKYSGFELDSSVLLDYLKAVRYNRKYIKNPEFRYGHAEGVIDSLIYCLAHNDANFDTSTTDAFDVLKAAIEEAGYDEQGHYTEDAHQAYRFIYEKQGLNPDEAKLEDVKIVASWQSTRQKIKNFFTRKKSVESESIPAPTKKKFSLFSSAKSLWQKGKKYVYGITFAALGLLALKSGSDSIQKIQKDSQKQEIKAPQKKSSEVSSNTFSWQPQAFNVASSQLSDSFLQLRLDTVRKIEANKQAYQQKQAAQKTKAIASANKPYVQTLSHNDSIKNAPYISSLEMHKASDLVKTVENQLNKGIFKAENGLTKERIAHAYLMCKVYADADRAGTQIVLDAITSQNKLTPAQQKAFTDYIINNVGERGVKLQALSVQKGNTNHHSAFNRASKQQQQHHIKTLQDVRRLHNR